MHLLEKSRGDPNEVVRLLSAYVSVQQLTFSYKHTVSLASLVLETFFNRLLAFEYEKKTHLP